MSQNRRLVGEFSDLVSEHRNLLVREECCFSEGVDVKRLFGLNDVPVLKDLTAERRIAMDGSNTAAEIIFLERSNF